MSKLMSDFEQKSSAQRRAENKYQQKNFATLGVKISKADAEAFRELCAARGQTVNAALSAYIATELAGAPEHQTPEAPGK